MTGPHPSLDLEACERARLARDPRFDGRFFIGVKTTGIYCRPICPVRAAKPENVRFFPSAAAASEAGFRPCLRCRPEAAPGTPAWNGTAATVSRALRLIDEGALDGGTAEELAARLGLGARQLSRLFQRHLGASPRKVAQTRRLLFAKQLLNETDLSQAQVALAAGFGSVRRFNDAVRKGYGMAPSRLRRGGARPAAGQSGEDIQLALSYRPPYNWPALMDYLALRATGGVEAVDGDSYRRSIALNGQAGWFEVQPNPKGPALILRVAFPDTTALLAIVERVRRIFDLAADPCEIESGLAKDPALTLLVAAQSGLRLPGAWDGFELAVRAILGQQVTVKGASTLAGRLAQRFGRPLARTAPASLARTFPEPSILAESDLTVIGLPRARAAAIQGLARAAVEGEVRFDGTQEPAALRQALVALPGIGSWTADYVALRALSQPDAFPAGDLGLIRAAQRLGLAQNAKELAACAESWRPWRAYAALHLWRSEGTAARDPQSGVPAPKRKETEPVLHAHG